MYFINLDELWNVDMYGKWSIAQPRSVEVNTVKLNEYVSAGQSDASFIPSVTIVVPELPAGLLSTCTVTADNCTYAQEPVPANRWVR